MRKFDLSLRSSRSSYFATFRHQLTILSKTDVLVEKKGLNMLGTFPLNIFGFGSGVERRASPRRARTRTSRKAWRRWPTCAESLRVERSLDLHSTATAKVAPYPKSLSL